jgi:hypothetical protein
VHTSRDAGREKKNIPNISHNTSTIILKQILKKYDVKVGIGFK